MSIEAVKLPRRSNYFVPTRQDGSSLNQPTVFFSHSRGRVLPVPVSTVEIREHAYAKMMRGTGIFRDSVLIIPDIWRILGTLTFI